MSPHLDLVRDRLFRSRDRFWYGLLERLLFLELERRLDLLLLRLQPDGYADRFILRLQQILSSKLNPHLYLEREPELLRLDLDLVRDRVRLLLSLPAHHEKKTPTVIHFAGDKASDEDTRGQRRLFSPPGSMAAEISDCVSRTLLMASSISLVDASAFRLALRFRPAASGFSLNKEIYMSVRSGWKQPD